MPEMSKPVIFTISAAWDDEAAVWSGPLRRHSGRRRCADARRPAGEDIRDGARPAAGQSPGHRSGIAVPADHRLARSRTGRGLNGAAVRPRLAGFAARRRLRLVRQGRGSHEIWHSPITQRNFAVPVGIPSRHTANAILRQAGLPKAF